MLCDPGKSQPLSGLQSHMSKVEITGESHLMGLMGGERGSCPDVESTQETWVHSGLSTQSEQEGDGRTVPGRRFGLPLLWSRRLPVSLRGYTLVGFRNKSISSCPPSLPPFALPSGPVRMN